MAKDLVDDLFNGIIFLVFNWRPIMRKLFLLVMLIIAANASYSQWEKCNDDLRSTKWNLYVEDGMIYASSNEGMYISTDKGNSWIPKNSGLTNKNINKMLKQGIMLIAGTEDGVFISMDNGENWIAKNNIVKGRVRAIAYDGSNLYISNYLTATKKSYFYVSTDLGDTWTQKNVDFALSIYSIFVDADKIFIDAKDSETSSGIYCSTDNGNEWKNIYNGALVDEFVKIGNDIFAACSNIGVLCSTDNGGTWEKRNNGNEGSGSICLYNKGDTLYSGDYTQFGGGFSYSTNKGLSWTSQIGGLTKNCAALYDLVILDGYIYAGTYDGLYKAKLSDMLTYIPETSVEDYIFLSPYLTSDFIEVNYNLSFLQMKESVITIYNTLGDLCYPPRRLGTSSQEGNIRIDISSFPMGVYFVRIGNVAKKFIKM